MTLRELLQQISEPPYKGTVPSVYALLEALVEAVEPEEHTCGECGLWNGYSGCRDKLTGRAPLAIHLVHPDSPACGDFVIPKEACAAAPEDTDATIRKLREKRDMFEQMWKDTAAILGDAIKAHDKTIDEARAEIERLKSLIADLTTGITMCRADAEG